MVGLLDRRMEHWHEGIDGRSIRAGSNDLEWPWKAKREGQNYPADLHYAPAVWPRITKFGAVTQVKRSMVSHVPITRGGAPASPKEKYDLYLRPNGFTQGDKIWYSNTYTAEAYF